ncbi:MAG: PEP-CTERM sorting domain-containing protein [Fimbriimonadales bacterium]|nr:PEP-CTERM sorting domain-containing protein [Fimbriimonadales bacterium]
MIHIQGIPPRGDSSKVIAPEPASMLALSAGLAGMLGLRRRKK